MKNQWENVTVPISSCGFHRWPWRDADHASTSSILGRQFDRVSIIIMGKADTVILIGSTVLPAKTLLLIVAISWFS